MANEKNKKAPKIFLSKLLNFFFFLLMFSVFAAAQEVSISTGANGSGSEISASSATLNNSSSDENFNLRISTPVCEKESDFKKSLLEMRLALQSYLHKNYRPPKDIEELFPLYISCKPKIKIKKDYEFSVEYVRTSDYDKNYTMAVTGNSSYLYFSDPQSIYFGLLLINSKSNSPDGTPYYLY
ncbi:MAG: hypothetical protein Fur0012_10210 [Elusimicrobiota bacterium]